MPNSILHSCCFPGPKRCQCKPFVASVIHPPLSHAPRETHREWWENYLTFWSSAGFFRGKKNDCGVFGFVAICPEQRSVLSRQYSRKNITFITLLEWNFMVPKPWKPPNFSEVLISSEVKEVQFFFTSAVDAGKHWGLRWTPRGELFCLRQLQDSPRLQRKQPGLWTLRRNCAKDAGVISERALMWKHKSNVASVRVCLTLNLPTREIN